MKLFLCGDVMTGRGIDQILRHPDPPHIYEDYVHDARDYVKLAEKKNGQIPRNVTDSYIWGDALKIWRRKKTGLKIINLETAVTSNETYMATKGINYRMSPRNLSIFECPHIDICTLANNHVLDWEYQGLIDTLKGLNHWGIKHAGAGKTLEKAQEPAIFENEEGRVLVFSMANHSSGVPFNWEARENKGGVFFLENLSSETVGKVRDVIGRFKREGDTIIVSLHWGSNWGYEVGEAEIDFAHQLIDEADVHIVHGHSSHHPRPIEIYKGRPILYGCGDFINDYEGIGGHEEFRNDLTLMYFIDCDLRPFKFHRLEMTCLQLKKFQLHSANRDDTDWMTNVLIKESEKFSTKFHLKDNNEIWVEGP